MHGILPRKAEVRAALAKMKRNKAADPDEIVTDILTALGNFGIEKLTEFINDVYDVEKFQMTLASPSSLPYQINQGFI